MNKAFVLPVCAAALFAAAGIVLAGDAADTVLCFETTGPDLYADGSTVLDGESYALIWTSDGVFDGFYASGAPVDENDRVLMVAPLAKGGRCPHTGFELSSAQVKALAGGKYGIWLLDTRVADDDGKVAPRAPVANAPALVNGYGAVVEDVSVKDSSATVQAKRAAKDAKGPVASEASAVASVAASVPDDVVQPRIKAIRIKDGRAVLTVENLPGFTRVHGGDTIEAIGATVGPAKETKGGPDVEIAAPSIDADTGFFRALRNR